MDKIIRTDPYPPGMHNESRKPWPIMRQRHYSNYVGSRSRWGRYRIPVKNREEELAMGLTNETLKLDKRGFYMFTDGGFALPRLVAFLLLAFSLVAFLYLTFN